MTVRRRCGLGTAHVKAQGGAEGLKERRRKRRLIFRTVSKLVTLVTISSNLVVTVKME